MCFHVDLGGRDRHKTGTIFTNTSALSMMGDEILLDGVEKELASEVELWRLETFEPGVCLQSAQPAVPQEHSLGQLVVSAIRKRGKLGDDHAAVSVCASAHNEPEGETHPDADETPTSVANSDTSSFAGFIEVPVDRGDRPEKVRILWRGVRPDRYAF